MSFLPLLLACFAPTTPVEVALSAEAGTQPLRCGQPVALDGHEVVLRDLRLYVHDVQLVGADGVAHDLRLTEDDWQSAGVALLDFEDGCHNGTSATNTTLRGHTRAVAPYQGVRFTLGVPAALNHADPLTLDPPLTTMAMHWGWQAGFKFVRFDYRLDGEAARMHLGSTGCVGPMGSVSGCDRANRSRMEVPLRSGSLAARLDLGPALTDAHAGAGCMADPTDPGCAPWLHLFGLPTDAAPHPVAHAFVEAP